MEWQATDQFGNLFVAESDSTDLDSLLPHLESLVAEIQKRAQGKVVVTVDLDYQEINGPDPDQVSHVLRVSWLDSSANEDTLHNLTDRVSEIAQSLQIEDFQVNIVS